MLTNDIVNFEQMALDLYVLQYILCMFSKEYVKDEIQAVSMRSSNKTQEVSVYKASSLTMELPGIERQIKFVIFIKSVT